MTLISPSWGRRVARGTTTAALALVVLATFVFPTTSVRAYTGSQTYRDEKDTCCFQTIGAWQTVTNTWNGFDYDHKYYDGGLFRWFAQPNPSPAAECPVVHIPDVPEAASLVAYNQYINGTNIFSVQVYQQYSPNYWENMTKSFFSTGDHIDMRDGDITNMAADVISFHWDSSTGYTDCTF